MSSAKGMILSAVARWALREARVVQVRELGERMRLVALEGPELRGASWTPGDKLQVLLPGKDVRTYTPTSWDAQRGTTELVLFAHGDSPGARWTREVAVGDTLHFVGPQRSLRRGGDRPAILFGDETGIGLAMAFAGTGTGAKLACVLEVASAAATRGALDTLGVSRHATIALVERTAHDAHLAEVARAITRLTRELPGAELVLSGRAQSIQALRPLLRSAGTGGRSSNKPYWSVGKAGLD